MISRCKGRLARLAAAAIITAMIAGPVSAAATYTIKRGGNLYDVSKRTGVPVQTLKDLNGIKDASVNMPAGRVIKLEAAPKPAPAKATPAAKPTPKAAPGRPAARQQTLPSRNATMREVLAERRYLAQKAGKTFTAPPKPAAPVTALLPSAKGEQLVASAREWMGTPYVYGGFSRNGIDCSGLVVRAAQKLDVDLPHRAADLFTMGKKVAYEEMRPGDLVFFVTIGDDVSHVGIYLGNDKFIHASSKYGVREQAIAGYYSERLCGARRVVD